MNFFLLPGNPPATHFYREWGIEIAARDPEARVEVARYPYFALELDSLDYFEQLTRVVAEQFFDFSQNAGPACLVGHSLGGYLALRVLARRPASVERCYLLHPFLRQPHWRGRGLLKLAHESRRLRSLENWLVRAQPLISRFAPDARALTADEIRVFTQLAYHEHRVIARDLSPLSIEPGLQPKVRVYSTNGDIWCPPSTVASLGGQVRHVCGPASHGFIVDRAERETVYDFIRADLAQPHREERGNRSVDEPLSESFSTP